MVMYMYSKRWNSISAVLLLYIHRALMAQLWAALLEITIDPMAHTEYTMASIDGKYTTCSLHVVSLYLRNAIEDNGQTEIKPRRKN